MPLMPGAEPYSADGADAGVLLLHGFTGSPHAMRGWAQHLHGNGYAVEVPLLPGHGTTWQDMAITRWPDWYACAEGALLALRKRCSTVFVAGLSMGGTLALRLAEHHPEIVRALVLVNPALSNDDRRLLALPIFQHVLRTVSGVVGDIRKAGVREVGYDKVPTKALRSLQQAWTATIKDLPSVVAPLLLLRSRVDHVVPASSARILLGRVSSTDVAEIILPDSYHVATLDNDAERINTASVQFLRRVGTGG